MAKSRNLVRLLARRGIRGAARARRLIDEPQHFLPTVQIGITLIGILTGVFGGVRIADPLAASLAAVPLLAPLSGTLALAVVVLVITYLSLVLGELVPKQLALKQAEVIAARVAGPLAWL